jgi:hypothetical protein
MNMAVATITTSNLPHNNHLILQSTEENEPGKSVVGIVLGSKAAFTIPEIAFSTACARESIAGNKTASRQRKRHENLMHDFIV